MGKLLDWIWGNYTQEDEYQEYARRHPVIPDDIRRRLCDELGDDRYFKAEDAIMSIAANAEWEGFQQGFKLAAMLMAECAS